MIKQTLKKVYRAYRSFIDFSIPKAFYKSRFLSNLYYLFLSSAFGREHQSVLAGKVKHIRESKNENYYLLVRNTHRIEKGLLMRPVRPVFAKDYLKETIDSLGGVWKNDSYLSTPQRKWFFDVLTKYFLTVQEDAFIAEQKMRFISITSEMVESDTECTQVPYIRAEKDNSIITFDEFYKLTKQRRSVRWFLNKPVPRDLIDKAILAANQSPSACNRQPFEFRVFDDPEMVKQVVDLPMGTKGYGHSIPVMIVVVGNLDAYFDERDRHIIYIDGSLASMSLMLALETLGLSSCAINWPDIEVREKKMETFLGLETHQRPMMCIGLGYPDPEGLVARSEKRSINQIRKYN